MNGLFIKMKKLNKYKFIVYCFCIFFISVGSIYSADNSKWLSINKNGMQAFKERDFLNSEKSELSIILAISSLISKGVLGLNGTTPSNSSVENSGETKLFSGIK